MHRDVRAAKAQERGAERSRAALLREARDVRNALLESPPGLRVLHMIRLQCDTALTGQPYSAELHVIRGRKEVWEWLMGLIEAAVPGQLDAVLQKARDAASEVLR